MTALAEAIVAVAVDDTDLRSTLGSVRTFIRQQVNLLSGLLGSIGFGELVKQGATFEDRMARTAAALEAGGVSGRMLEDEMGRLREAAVRFGTESMYSSKEVAEAIQKFAQLGFTARESIQALPAILNLAAAGELDMADATRIAGQTMRQSGASAADLAHIVDVLAVAAARSSLDVKTLGIGMSYVGNSGHSLGITLEEVAASIAVLSDGAMESSRAGTSLRAALQHLVKQVATNKGALRDWGLLDENGNLKNMADMVDILNKRLHGLSDVAKLNFLQKIFETRGAEAVMALMNQGGNRIRELQNSFEGADGMAEKMRMTIQGSLLGAFNMLKATAVTTLSEISSRFKLIPTLAAFARAAVNSFNQLSSSVKDTVAAFIEVAGVFAITAILLPQVIGMVKLLASAFALPGEVAMRSMYALLAPVRLLGSALSGLVDIAGIAMSFVVFLAGEFASLLHPLIGSLFSVIGTLVYGLFAGLSSVVTFAFSIITAAVSVLIGIITTGIFAALGILTIAFVAAFNDPVLGKEMKATLFEIMTTIDSITSAVLGMKQGSSAWESLKRFAVDALKSIEIWLKMNWVQIVITGQAIYEALVVGFDAAMAKMRQWVSLARGYWESFTVFIQRNRSEFEAWGASTLAIAQNVWGNMTRILARVSAFVAETWGGVIGQTEMSWDKVVKTITAALKFIEKYTKDFDLTWKLVMAQLELGWVNMTDSLKAKFAELGVALIEEVKSWPGRIASAFMGIENVGLGRGIGNAIALDEGAMRRVAQGSGGAGQALSEGLWDWAHWVAQAVSPLYGITGPIDIPGQRNNRMLSEATRPEMRNLPGGDPRGELLNAGTLRLREEIARLQEAIAKASEVVSNDLTDFFKGILDSVGMKDLFAGAAAGLNKAWLQIANFWEAAVKGAEERGSGTMETTKSSFVKFDELYKKIQEGLSSNSTQQIQEKIANGVAEANKIASNAKDILGNIRDGIKALQGAGAAVFAGG